MRKGWFVSSQGVYVARNRTFKKMNVNIYYEIIFALFFACHPLKVILKKMLLYFQVDFITISSFTCIADNGRFSFLFYYQKNWLEIYCVRKTMKFMKCSILTGSSWFLSVFSTDGFLFFNGNKHAENIFRVIGFLSFLTQVRFLSFLREFDLIIDKEATAAMVWPAAPNVQLNWSEILLPARESYNFEIFK